jgi:hypothetical protein
MAEDATQAPAPLPVDKKRKPTWNVEITAAGILGILALVFCAWQVKAAGPNTTGTQTFLFNSLQFVCTVGFAWFSTKAASRAEFEQSLKKFAISAYRRIDDIERMIDRLHREVCEMTSTAPKSEISNLRIVDAIVTDTRQLVRSSISDWGDVIGEELLAIEQIKRLEHQKELLQKDDFSAKISNNAAAVKSIDASIAKVQSTLPLGLQLTTDNAAQMPQRLRRPVEWLAREHRRDGGLRMTVVTGDEYLCERNHKTLEAGEVLVTDRKNTDRAIDVRDLEGRGVGRLQNPTPLGYDDFVAALGLCFGDPLRLEFRQHEGEETRDGKLYAWLAIRLLTDPIAPQKASPCTTDAES